MFVPNAFEENWVHFLNSNHHRRCYETRRISNDQSMLQLHEYTALDHLKIN